MIAFYGVFKELSKSKFELDKTSAAISRRNSVRLSELLLETVGNDFIKEETKNDFQAPIVRMRSICSITDNMRGNEPKEHASVQEEKKTARVDPVNIKAANGDTIHDFDSDENRDAEKATYFDVAVLRCLLSAKWRLDGYLWSLEYLNSRLNEIADETLKETEDTKNFKTESFPYLMKNTAEKPNKAPLNPFIDTINLLYVPISSSKENLTPKKNFESNFNKRIR